MLSRRSFVAAVAALVAPLLPLPALAADKDPVIKVACVGDSITYGAGIKDRDVNSYPAVLGKLLGDKYEVKNFGNSGSTLLRAGDKAYHKQKEYAAAIAFKPDIVVIKLGTNDSKPQNWAKKADFAADYKKLVADFKAANPAAKVYAALPVPVYGTGNFKITDEVVKPEVIPAIKQVAADEKLEVIDLYAALSDKPKLFPDKVHPNAEGAKLIAKAVYKAITGKDAAE
ncbi:MAG TPA: GDSL-type esterase/lipase family protein [Humisphaera sp.]